MSRRLKLSWILAVTALAIIAWLVGRTMLAIDWHGVWRAWSALPPTKIAASFASSLISFCMLGLLDVLASRFITPKRVSAKRAASAGALSHAFSHTLGFAAVTSIVTRYRIYASW